MDGKWTDMLQEWSGSEPAHILLIVAGAVLLYEIIRHSIPYLLLKESHARFYTLPWIPMLRLIVIAGAVYLITPIVITPTRENVLALAGASALAVGFALKDYISSLFAGILFLFERPYKVGDWIDIGGAYGEVVELGMRAVTLLTADDDTIIIPHNTLWSTQILNSTGGQKDMLCVIDFFVDPDHDEATVRQVLANVAAGSIYISPERPVVVVMFNKPFGLYYKVKAYPEDARQQFLFIADVTERGNFALRKLGLKPLSAPVAVSG
jgi:small-conductance mechanosensitive channel